MILVFSLVTSSFTCKVWAKGGTPVYQLQESSIVYKENQKKILLDLCHRDSPRDNGCSYGQYNEREIANKITLQVKQLLEAEGIDVDLTRSYDDVISIVDELPQNFVVTNLMVKVGSSNAVMLNSGDYSLISNVLTVTSVNGSVITIPAGETTVLTINGYFE